MSDSVNNFIDTLNSNFLLPLIFLPTRISKTSTLIDNIFSNSTSLEEIESGNSTWTFSDHLPMPMHLLKNLTKRKWSFSPDHGLQKVCKTLLKRKTTFTQNLLIVKAKLWNNYIETITKSIEIFYLHSTKEVKKVFHKLLQKKHQRYKEDLERYKNFSIIEAKNNDTPYINDPVSIANTLMIQSQLLILLIPFFTSIAKIAHSKNQIFKLIIQEILVIRNKWFFPNNFCK